MAVIGNMDEYEENADWIKQTWDLPPYRSEEFFEALKFANMTLKHFRTLSVYKFAVEKGLIKNDKWTGENNG